MIIVVVDVDDVVLVNFVNEKKWRCFPNRLLHHSLSLLVSEQLTHLSI